MFEFVFVLVVLVVVYDGVAFCVFVAVVVLCVFAVVVAFVAVRRIRSTGRRARNRSISFRWSNRSRIRSNRSRCSITSGV